MKGAIVNVVIGAANTIVATALIARTVMPAVADGASPWLLATIPTPLVLLLIVLGVLAKADSRRYNATVHPPKLPTVRVDLHADTTTFSRHATEALALLDPLQRQAYWHNAAELSPDAAVAAAAAMRPNAKGGNLLSPAIDATMLPEHAPSNWVSERTWNVAKGQQLTDSELEQARYNASFVRGGDV